MLMFSEQKYGKDRSIEKQTNTKLQHKMTCTDTHCVHIHDDRQRSNNRDKG